MTMLDRIKQWCDHSRTIFAARLLHIAAALVAAHDLILPYIAGQDWTPLTAELPAWAWPLIMVTLGASFEWLRRVTTGPVTKQE